MEHPPQDDARLDPATAEVEEVDAVPVLSPAGAIEPQRAAGQVVVRQAAAVAATSFAAGIATVAWPARTRCAAPGGRSQRAMAPIIASRSFLVDVHLLGPRD